MKNRESLGPLWDWQVRGCIEREGEHVGFGGSSAHIHMKPFKPPTSVNSHPGSPVFPGDPRALAFSPQKRRGQAEDVRHPSQGPSVEKRGEGRRVQVKRNITSDLS